MQRYNNMTYLTLFFFNKIILMYHIQLNLEFFMLFSKNSIKKL
jgi:hypothetical protein